MYLQYLLLFIAAWETTSSRVYHQVEDLSMDFEDLEIQFFPERKSYSQASIKCREWGGETGTLAMIKTPEMQNVINSKLSKLPHRSQKGWYSLGYFVGATKSQHKKWRWQDSTLVNMRGVSSWQNWGRHEPKKNRNRENCMSIKMKTIKKFQGYGTGCWIDSPCNAKKFFICQKKKLATPASCDVKQRVVPFTMANCDTSEDAHSWDIVDWVQDRNTQWVMTNTGKDLEITIKPPGSLVTVVRKNHENINLKVNKIRIKWGADCDSGSEHSMGKFKVAGEIQIFHEHHEVLGRHALSFLIRERHSPANMGWTSLLRQAREVKRIDSTRHIHQPPTIKSLLVGDSTGPHNAQFSYRIGQFIRYEGTSTEQPCTPHVWTVFKRGFYLSTYQLDELRSLDIVLPETITPAQVHLKSSSSTGYCQVTKYT